ncbi:MAG: Fe-S cluster assembly protein SufD [Rhizobiales bacterium]|nr:Fe-S cluster assembly protein SufD [Hyphomicrobiales bacterium]
MRVDVIRTRAETALGDHFAAAAERLAGNRDVAKARANGIARFQAHGLPGRRNEEWKYTDLRAHVTEAYEPLVAGIGGTAIGMGALEEALGPLAGLAAARLVVVDGRFEPNLSSAAQEGDGVSVRPLAEVLAGAGAADFGRIPGVPESDVVAALNEAFASDGVVVEIDGTERRIVHIVHLHEAAAPGAVTTRNVIRVAAGASALVVESHFAMSGGARQVNCASVVTVAEGGRLDHVKLLSKGEATTHLSTWSVELARMSRYVATQLTRGGKLTRNQVYLKFSGELALAHLNGVMMQRASQHCDSTLVVDHVAPACESRELFKAVLDDEARAVFQGKITVRPEAQKTDGRQMSQALLLSETAEFDAKPELEIFADDVACGHGATSGQLDENMLFYLRARGVPEVAAKALLIEAFAGEALDEVEEPELREVMADITRGWLAEGQTRGRSA